MAELRRVPPGRAGRLWLRRRLATAEHAVDLLDRKVRILRAEQEQLRVLAGRTGAEWQARCREAERWLARAAALGGEREILLASVATTAPGAEADVEWGSVMGARFPVRAHCRLPQPSGQERAPGTAALDEAVAAYRESVVAGLAHAVAREAYRVVDAEVAETRRRLRALNDRWLPRLGAAARDLNERLEENERAETTRIRWAAARTDRWPVQVPLDAADAPDAADAADSPEAPDVPGVPGAPDGG
ncbi:MAG TPA: V-type ATP synthase subunit D [Micromonosporaceae bacterium]|nr:V-type ATP synthase subunit D [Micromonosporaceae bacterium]